MLHIVRSTLTLKGELQRASDFVVEIINALSDISSKSDLTKEIGVFIPKTPEFKVLEKDFSDCKQGLRKVCSGEIDIPKAIVLFSEAYDELNLLSETLKDFTGEITIPEE